jgi:hypothetical protein
MITKENMEKPIIEVPCPVCDHPVGVVPSSSAPGSRWVCLRCQVVGFLPPMQPVTLPAAILAPLAHA